MTSRPIIMTGASVRAILAGRKTQTRRIVKFEGDEAGTVERLERHHDRVGACAAPSWSGKHDSGYGGMVWHAEEGTTSLPIRCPFGGIGSRLWVKESWRTWERPADGVDGVLFAADYTFRSIENTSAAADNGKRGDKWRSSLFMPRWASRLTLEITEIRVQRLQAISGDDVGAEGVLTHCASNVGDPITAFARHWDEINGKRAPWASNPWTWALTFRAVTP